MTAEEIVQELSTLGHDSYKKVMLNHGAQEPIFGVKVEDLKKIQKRIKKDYQLAKDLYDTGISDAMYLAGLIADDDRMTREDLQHWVENTGFYMHSEYTVPWVSAQGRYGHEMALAWVESDVADIAAAGWATLANLVSLKDDEELDLPELEGLLERVETTIHQQPNRVRYVMNGFVIAVGGYVAPLTRRALEAAAKIGKVKVDMGGTACKVPAAAEHIRKMEERGNLGKKRKTVKC